MKPWLVLATLLLAATAHAADDPLWNEPDRIERDEDGHVVMQVLHDRATYTIRHIWGGQTVTEHFFPHTALLLYTQRGDMIEEPLYAEGAWVYGGERIHIDGLALPIHSYYDRRISGKTLGPFTIMR